MPRRKWVTVKEGLQVEPPKIVDADPPGTIVITPDYVKLPGLTAMPTSEPGVFYYRSDEDRISYVNASSAQVLLAKYPVDTGELANYAVTTSKLADNAVITAKIADGAVTEPKLADSAVSTAKIKDGAVTEAKLADSAVSTSKIKDGAVTDAKITGPIDPGKIGEGNLNLGTGNLTCNKIYCSLVQVGDINLKYGWSLREMPDELLIVKDGRVVARIHKDKGLIPTRRGLLGWLLGKLIRNA